MNLVIDILSWACLLSGAAFCLIGAIGMVRLPDVWARLHGASVIDAAGFLLLMFGMMLQAGLSLITIKLAVILLFVLITGPTASHAVANAAYVSGLRPKQKAPTSKGGAGGTAD